MGLRSSLGLRCIQIDERTLKKSPKRSLVRKHPTLHIENLWAWKATWSTHSNVWLLVTLHSHLHRVNPGFDASYSFHCGNRSPVQRADGYQARCYWIMAVIEWCKENPLESWGWVSTIQRFPQLCLCPIGLILRLLFFRYFSFCYSIGSYAYTLFYSSCYLPGGLGLNICLPLTDPWNLGQAIVCLSFLLRRL